MADNSSRAAAERERIRDAYGRRRSSAGRGVAYLVEERRRLLLRAATEFGGLSLDAARIVDVGCGGGGDLGFWREQGVSEHRLAGTELLPERASAATERLPGAAIVQVQDFTVPFPDASFEFTSAALVLSSVLDAAARAQLFSEMVRVTAAGGVIAVYDFRIRKPWNPSVVAMTSERIGRLWKPPHATWPAAPFLPVLSPMLRLPAPVRRFTLRSLPRTHCLYLWHR